MKFFLVLIMFVVALSSCNKTHCTEKIIECSDGNIYWGGDPLADGAGWYFAASRYSQPWYHIENPPEEYKVDGIAVSICLAEIKKPIICGMCVGSPPNYYEIKQITKR